MLWITVCESRTAPSRLLCLAGMIGRATQAHSIQNTKGSKEKGKRSVIYQIRLYKGISAKCQERILFGSKIDLVCLCMFISVFILYTHKTNTKKKLQMDCGKTGMRKRSFSLPDCLSFQPPLSRDAVTLVSHSYCYEFSIVISRLHSCHKAGWMAHMAIDVTLCCSRGI